MIINRNNLRKYLVEKSIISNAAKCEIDEIHGGLFNRVYWIKTGDGFFITKQFLDKAKIDKNIKLSPKRFFYEKDAISYMDNILDEKITPKVIFFDDINKIICMEDMGIDNRLDNLLLSGKFDAGIFSKIGKVIAEIHNKSSFNKALPVLFDNEYSQERKVIHRYYDGISEHSLEETRDILVKNTRRNRMAFIHNDLKMNNLFVLGNNEFRLIDYEASYYGDPAFDIGYFLGHLFVYYFYKPNTRNRQMILNFWENYIRSLDFACKERLEWNVVKHTGFIMINKLTGIAKDDFHFINSRNKEKIISMAKKIIQDKNIRKVRQLFDVL